MVLSPDFREFIELLNATGVSYLVVWLCLGAMGAPATPKTLIFGSGSILNRAQRMLQAIDRFGFGSLGLTRDDFLEKENVIQLGYPPSRIDILTDLDNLTFTEC